ncbi:MAG: protein kinase [Gammaproteobacteria bacterium]|nr:protein kinase [Gammaproteobacteria bacterium]MBU1654027.1 protein kinase [Gammaproteobacteria bacterium]MBU1959696.1 protein kinase [Gammaproteobacteria bacterium]
MIEAGQEIKLERYSYRLNTPLNHGNQGQVWRATGLHDGTEYAFKTLLSHDDPQIQSDLAQRLRDEIAFLQNLPDPEAHFIIPCQDAGEWEYGWRRYPAFVMPLLPVRLTAHDRAPDGAALLRWAAQIAEALRWLLAQGQGGRNLVHRDIKPDNILLTDEGDLRLIDFGIAKAMGGTGTLGHRDMSYFAPEQRLPIRPGAYADEDVVSPSPKSDLYCLGLILFRLAIGRSAVPKAQLRLREDRTRGEHIARLKEGGRGLIGEIGGLEAKERRELRDAVKGLLEGNTGGTLVFQGRPSLPDLPLIAEVFAEQVERLLAPAPRSDPMPPVLEPYSIGSKRPSLPGCSASP